MNIVWIVFVSAFFIQMLFWVMVFRQLVIFIKRNKKSTEHEVPRPVSVIICARNEAENLRKNLPAVLNQKYPEFEVLVVNDGSSDDTASVLSEYQKDYDHLSVLHLGDKPKEKIGKKYALERGILASRYPWVLLTDADCQPATEKWIEKMNAGLPEGKSIGLGYGPYCKKKGLLNKLIRFETVYTAIQYFSFAICGMPYMGVGRNLFYHKKLFFDAEGFASHEHINSGDDDLFINAVATKTNTDIILNNETFVFSEPKITFSEYVYQKSRHFSTSKHYKIKNKIQLFALSLSHFLFYGGFFTLLVFEFRFTTVLFLFLGTRIIFLHLLYEVILQELKEKDLLIWIPVLDLLYILFILLLAPTLLLTNMRKWK